MTTTVLAYFPSPAQGVWYLGPVPIRAYALCIIAGIIAALVIGDRRWVARGGERGVIYDIALWAVPFGLIGGRLYHLMTDWRTYFGPGGAGVGAALRIWEGGLGIWGAVALGGVGAWIACRRRGIPLPAFGDAVAPGIVLAQAIGRLGNYFNQELYGRETTVPWGMEIFYRRDSSGMVDVHSLDGVSTGQVAAVVHPTFLYELLWNLAVFGFLIFIDRKYRIGHGRLFAMYVASYCVGRFWVELLRDDTATHIAGIRINVFTATFVFIGAVVYILLAPKGREDPATLRGHDPVETREEQAVEEFAEDLVSAAKGSGLVAAVTVAGEHEDEDLQAAEHAEPEPAEYEPAESEFTEPEPAVSEPAVSEATESEATESEPTVSEAADSEPAESEAAESEPAESKAAESETAADGESAAPTADVVAEVEAGEAEAETELERELAATGDAVEPVETTPDDSADSEDSVVSEDLGDSGDSGDSDSGQADEPDIEADSTDPAAEVVAEAEAEAEAEIESGAVAEAEIESEIESGAVAEAEVEAGAEIDTEHQVEEETVAVDEAAEAAGDDDTAAEAVVDEEVDAIVADDSVVTDAGDSTADDVAAQPEPESEPAPELEPEPKLSKTLRRLLWGARG